MPPQQFWKQTVKTPGVFVLFLWEIQELEALSELN